MKITFKRFWRSVRQSLIVKRVRSLLPNCLVDTFWHLPIAWMAAAWYGFPAGKLTSIGVTGTDGKTTTVYLINHILKAAGYKTAMISSVAAEIDGEQSDTGFHVTSPHPFAVQRYLKQAVDKGVGYGVLEVTSHALDQHRFAGCSFDYAVLTNIKSDHLDYHKTYDNYLHTKSKLFRNAKVSVLNKDDQSFDQIYMSIDIYFSEAKQKIITYSVEGSADFTLEKIDLQEQPGSLPGKYNLLNILAGSAVALNLGIDKKIMGRAIQSFSGVPGRFEEIESKKGFRVIVDFAHTPYALQEFLQTVRAQIQGKGRLITVFGCAAERGKERRKMGKVSAELADITIITAEDPRYEGVEKISEDIAYWATEGGATELHHVQSSKFKVQGKKHYYIRISERQKAINFAVSIAEENDVVALCGKGHEKSMNFAGIEYPWDERKAVEKALAMKA